MIDTFLKTLLPLIVKLWWVIGLVIILAICRIPIVKGWIGELIVNFIAKLFLNKRTYHLLKNVTIPTEDGTTQIDHIIISKFGVFVVETKNYKGWIKGSLDHKQKEWTQQIYKVVNKFQNPLRQNYKHTKTLEEALNLPSNKIHSVIVFIGDTTFKTQMPENVTQGIGYIKYIKSFKNEVLTEEEVNSIIEKIATDRLKPSFKTHIQHVKHVKEIIKSKEDDHSRFMPKTDNRIKHLTAEICPECKAPMEFCKKGSRFFWRCPKCNIDYEVSKLSCPQCNTTLQLLQRNRQIILKCSKCSFEEIYLTLDN